MRVLLLTLNPNLGASARTLQDWLLQGRSQGLEVSVVLRQTGDLSQWLEEHRIPHRINPMPWPERWKPWQWVKAAWKVARWARLQGIQLVHCYEHELYPFARGLARLIRRPLLCHCHFLIERDFAVWAFAGPRKRPAALIWTSREQKQACVPALKDIVPEEHQHILSLGLDLTRFGSRGAERAALRQQWGIAPDTLVIGTANALRARKRIDDFLELVTRLRQRHTNVIGVLAGGPVPGDEAYAERIIPKLHALEAGGGFHWLGNLEPIEPFMHAIDVFVSTSEYETFGMSVLEAMACRKPVAAYRGGSVQEVVYDTGIIVPNTDLPALCEGVSQLIADSNLRVELGERAYRRVAETYDPARSLKRLLALYRSLLPTRVVTMDA
jgi:glycosyltransferase involved in cell wall biosynthesis